MQITKQKAQELGILLCKEKCITCNSCCIKNDVAYCKIVNEAISIMYVAGEGCPLVSEEEIKEKMTPEEYKEYCFGEVEIMM